MNLPRWRNSFAFLLLLVLLVPALAACGGPTATTTQTTAPAGEATAATNGGAAATTAATEAPAVATAAPAAEAPTTAEATTEATTAAEETTAPEATATEATAGGATGGGAATGSPNPDTLRLAYTADPDTADPQKASFVDEISFIMMNYQPLMTFDPKDLKPVPGAAQSVDISKDGKTYTFKLKPSQTYSDGSALTAKNFEDGWKRLCDPQIAGEYGFIGFPIVGCEQYYTAFDTGGLTVTDKAKLQALREKVGVKAVDANTLQIQLSQPAGYFLNVAALWVGVPTRLDLVEKGGETFWQNPDTYIGNGPFKLVEYQPGSKQRWERNDSWVLKERAPKFTTVDKTFVAESQVAFESYRSGELDMVGVAGEDLPTVQGDPQLKGELKEQGGTCTFYLGFNLARKPFDNKQVRQAFSTALDREAWVRDVLKGNGDPAYSFIRPGLPGHDPSSQKFKYDAAKAKKMLQDAGFDFNQEIKLTFSQSARNKLRYEYLASRFQKDLGVKITLDPVERTTYTALTKDPKTTPPMFILGWCLDYPDPQDWLSVVFHTGGNQAKTVSFSNKQYDALLDKADALNPDDPQRMQLYKQAQDMLIDDAPAAMFWYDKNPFLQKPYVTGVNPTVVDPSFPGFYSMETIEIKGE